MVAGTMLGAVGHNGFIPWDDDVDIAMLRKDCDRFIRIAHQLLPSHLRIRNSDIEDGYMFITTKVDHKETILVEKKRRDYGHYGGIFIDVFPLDNAPDNHIKRKILYKVVRRLRRYLDYHYETLDFNERRLISLIKAFIKLVTSEDLLKRLLNYFTTLYNGSDTRYLANYYGTENETMENHIIGDPRLYYFENGNYFGVEDYDEYLKIYMEII